MALRSLTRATSVVPKFCLVYFKSDKTTSIVDTKKLRDKETGEAFCGTVPEKRAEATLRYGSETFEATIIASDGKLVLFNA